MYYHSVVSYLEYKYFVPAIMRANLPRFPIGNSAFDDKICIVKKLQQKYVNIIITQKK